MKTSKVELYINGILQPSVPIYSNKLSIDMERENDEMFRRTKLNSAFTFVGADFDAIYNASIDTEFELRVKDAETDILLAKGTFEKTDCTFNVDDKKCEVKATVSDKYTKLLAGVDNEYDLVELAPVRETITLHKRAIIQLYVLGDTKITDVVGSTSFEIDANSEVDINGESKPVEDLTPDEVTSFHFLLLKYLLTVNVKADSELASQYPLLNGVYSGTKDGNTIKLTNQNGYYIEINKTQYPTRFAYLYDNTGGVVTYVNANVGIEYDWSVSDDYPYSITDGLQCTARGQSLPCGETSHRTTAFFARLLFDHIPSGLSYDTVPKNDICANNLNYRYVAGLNILGMSDRIRLSNEVQTKPTKWGVNGEGKYFVKPQEPSFMVEPNARFIPIGFNMWIPSSYWFLTGSSLIDFLSTYDASFELQDAYPLWSAIKVLLHEIDPTISFEGTAAYSEFLYGNILTLDAYVKQLLYITPITNVKKTYYNQAARKGKITLTQILNLLRATCQLYWFIDDQNRLRFEHISWFKNGGTYVQPNPVIANLTEMKSPMSMKPWSFSINTFEYIKNELCKRYEFEWSADCTEPFDGYALNVKNKFAQNGKTKKSTASNFVADIDFIVSAPDVLSDDILVVIGVDPTTKICPISGVGALGHNIDCPSFIMQNPYLSFWFAELAYWKYDLSGSSVVITEYKDFYGNEASLNVVSTQRIRKQSIKFPISPNKVGKEGLFRTNLGNGEWIKASYTPEDGMLTADIILSD